MGSFSWLRAESTIQRKNIAMHDKYKILIPKEFGGGFISDEYFDYGYVFYGTDHRADLYGILAYWNHCEGMIYSCEEYPKTMDEILKYGNTPYRENRQKGIEIGDTNAKIKRLKYPLKLVSASYKLSYEECEGRSYIDPAQGLRATYWDDTKELKW